MVCSTLRNSIPKSIVYCQVREAKRSLLDHFFTELGAREVRFLKHVEVLLSLDLYGVAYMCDLIVDVTVGSVLFNVFSKCYLLTISRVAFGMHVFVTTSKVCRFEVNSELSFFHVDACFCLYLQLVLCQPTIQLLLSFYKSNGVIYTFLGFCKRVIFWNSMGYQ